MNTKVKYFIDFVKEECLKEGVKCDLRNTTYVKISPSIKASGYFDESVPTLVCSMNRPDFVEILAHEYGHLTQWRDQIPLWKAVEVSINKVDEWLEGKDVHNIKKHIAACRDLELDNEKRAVKIIKQFELPVNIDHYVKKANAYVYFYTRLLSTRKWCTPKNSPYSNKRVIACMPNTFKKDYSTIPKKIEDVFIEENL